MRHKIKIVLSNSFEETRRIGEEFVKSHLARQQGEAFSGATLLALYGELGSGKTTFVQGFAKGLGIKRRTISPTFIIVRSYDLRFKIYDLRFEKFYHIDLYRIQDGKDLESLGIEEIIDDPKNIVALEWAEKIVNLLPKKRLDFRFKHSSEDKRRITVKKYE